MIKVISPEYNDSEVSLSIESLRLDICDKRLEDGVIGFQIKYFDLKQLKHTTLLYEFPDYEQRRQEAEKEANEKRTENTVLGAIAGAGIDLISGNDDAVLDGACLLYTSPSPRD